MNDLEGTLLKGYKLEERIGSGGFGAVYRAKRTTVGQEVAIKIIYRILPITLISFAVLKQKPM